MNDYMPNSSKYKPEQTEAQKEKKKLEKVVNGPVKVKKNEVRKLTDIFIAEDAKDVKSYIIMDVIIPALKNTLEDIIIGGTRMILRGETGNRGSGRSTADKISYSNYYNRDARRPSDERTARTKYSYDDIVVKTRGEAEDVLFRLDEAIATYGVASIGDLYDLVGITGDYTDEKYGWTNLSSAKVVPVRDGYLLKFPRVCPIDR